MLRIVPLIASATEIVHALGLGPFQVGRSHECDYPPEVINLPICTRPAFLTQGSSAQIDARVKETLQSALSVYEVLPEVLDQLHPTHIVTQTHCEVCAVSLKDVERALAGTVSSRPVLVSLSPNCLADIWTDIQTVADACGVPQRGQHLINNLKGRMTLIRERAFKRERRPKVACIEWQEPLMAAGNWVPELLELANADNLFGTAGGHSPYMSWDQLRAADPDVILVSPCGYNLEQTRAEMHWLTAAPGWRELRAVSASEVYLIDGNQFMNRPGPRIVESLEMLAEILHSPYFNYGHCGKGWQRFSEN